MSGRFGKREDRGRVPTADDFSDQAISRAVLTKTVNHLATTIPAGISAVCALWWGVIGPTPLVAGLCLGTGLLGMAGWVVNYFFRGDTFVRRHVAELRERREKHKRMEGRSLVEKCSRAGFAAGIEAAEELEQAYQNLHGYLREHVEKGRRLSAERFMVLAEDTYAQGLASLEKALAIHIALEQIDAGKLEQEVEDWLERRAELERDGDASQSEIEALTTRIESHRKRLQVYISRQSESTRLLAECEKLEGALETAYLDVIDLVNRGDMVIADTGAASRLEGAVKAARRVEEQLRGHGDTRAEDEQYLEAGRNLQEKE